MDEYRKKLRVLIEDEINCGKSSKKPKLIKKSKKKNNDNIDMSDSNLIKTKKNKSVKFMDSETDIKCKMQDEINPKINQENNTKPKIKKKSKSTNDENILLSDIKLVKCQINQVEIELKAMLDEEINLMSKIKKLRKLKKNLNGCDDPIEVSGSMLMKRKKNKKKYLVESDSE